MSRTDTVPPVLQEMREFASFAPAEQRYIRRSLDIAHDRGDAFARWARDAEEGMAIRRQHIAYRVLEKLRSNPPPHYCATFHGRLVELMAFDLSQERLRSFSATRFLYERLLGASARPWLPSSFCAAAALPQIEPTRRRDLLQTLSEAAATAPAWSEREPLFHPDYVESEPV